ncbi:22131_t:CDS:2 [Gigaspora rosea]|nr:22131_t:CDS:2 [Gigaspora rosea]
MSSFESQNSYGFEKIKIEFVENYKTKFNIKSARHFLEVVLIDTDTTYKTNIYKQLFVNFVGIGNFGVNKLQSFGIASAWISDKSENSYIWIINQLISLIFPNLYPLSKLCKIELQYMSFLNEQQKPGLLNKLDGILAVPEIKLSDIKVPERIIEKGCPSGTKRLLTALEYIEQ